MAGGANKAFLANIQNFLANNIIIIDLQENVKLTGLTVGANSVKYVSGVCLTVDLVRDTNNEGRKTNGTLIPVYRVIRATGLPSVASHRFKAYYLPFRSNDVRTMNLNPTNHGGKDAKVFFTDTMNGCSFACGPGANPKVGHFNRTVGGNDSAGIDQGAIDVDINNEFGGGTRYEVKRNDYKTGVADYSSLMGVKTGGNWQFYWQRREWVGAPSNKSPTGKLFELADGMPTLVT